LNTWFKRVTQPALSWNAEEHKGKLEELGTLVAKIHKSPPDQYERLRNDVFRCLLPVMVSARHQHSPTGGYIQQGLLFRICELLGISVLHIHQDWARGGVDCNQPVCLDLLQYCPEMDPAGCNAPKFSPVYHHRLVYESGDLLGTAGDTLRAAIEHYAGEGLPSTQLDYNPGHCWIQVPRADAADTTLNTDCVGRLTGPALASC
jgi:hypothetical protein